MNALISKGFPQLPVAAALASEVCLQVTPGCETITYDWSLGLA